MGHMSAQAENARNGPRRKTFIKRTFGAPCADVC
jgi:hypothetical protein